MQFTSQTLGNDAGSGQAKWLVLSLSCVNPDWIRVRAQMVRFVSISIDPGSVPLS